MQQIASQYIYMYNILAQVIIKKNIFFLEM